MSERQSSATVDGRKPHVELGVSRVPSEFRRATTLSDALIGLERQAHAVNIPVPRGELAAHASLSGRLPASHGGVFLSAEPRLVNPFWRG